MFVVFVALLGSWRTRSRLAFCILFLATVMFGWLWYADAPTQGGWSGYMYMMVSAFLVLPLYVIGIITWIADISTRSQKRNREMDRRRIAADKLRQDRNITARNTHRKRE